LKSILNRTSELLRLWKIKIEEFW